MPLSFACLKPGTIVTILNVSAENAVALNSMAFKVGTKCTVIKVASPCSHGCLQCIKNQIEVIIQENQLNNYRRRCCYYILQDKQGRIYK
jgi:hypothetical protein